MSAAPKPSRTRQGPLTIWHMMTLGQMVRALRFKPQLHWSKAHKIALLPGMGIFNSAMRFAEQMIYGRRVRETQIEQPPLFLIGNWRSGTTLLHNLMAQDPRFNSPTMYQAAFAHHFLLTQDVMTRLTGWMMPKRRPMDNLPAGWDIPQEEDIGMGVLTQISPYVMSADPDRFDYLRPHWDLSGLTAREFAFWRETYLTYLKRITLKDPERRRLVLKSPVNTLRIPVLLEMFPDAKFVCIHRNPYHVFNSSVHMRRTLLSENCLGRPELRDLEENIFWVHEFVFNTYQRDKQLIPEGRLHEVRFEDLEVDPLGQLGDVYSQLELGGWDEMKQIIEPQVPALKRYRKNVFPDDPSRMQMIYDRLKFAFEHYDYPSPIEEAADVAAA